VPPQRRLAISRLRVPNLDGFVIAAAGNLFSIGTPHHRVDAENCKKSGHKSTETERGKLEGKKTWKKNIPARVPASTRTQKRLSSPPTRSSPSCHRCRWPAYPPRSMPPTSPCNCEKSTHKSIKAERQKTCEEKLTCPSARSPDTRKST